MKFTTEADSIPFIEDILNHVFTMIFSGISVSIQTITDVCFHFIHITRGKSVEFLEFFIG